MTGTGIPPRLKILGFVGSKPIVRTMKQHHKDEKKRRRHKKHARGGCRGYCVICVGFKVDRRLLSAIEDLRSSAIGESGTFLPSISVGSSPTERIGGEGC